MDLHNKETNMRSYTLKSRKKIRDMVSFVDVRNSVIKDAEVRGLPEPTIEQILEECNKAGVNLETVQSKRNATNPSVKNNSSQRLDLCSGHIMSSVMPLGLYADYPYFDSCMRHDLYTRSSCIKRASGVIRFIAKIVYQFRRIYVYELNGVYDYFETDGIKETNGFGVIERTDLDSLPVNEEVDISQDSFLIKYPDQYNPTTDTVGMGINVRTIVATNWDNSGDSNLISQSLAHKISTIKQKTVRFKLNNKSIKSKFKGKFPPIGEILTDTIIFKIVNDIGYISDLAQSARMSTGSEDDTIVVDKNSYITSIEVYCNNPCKDPDLERYRQELLKFRHDVYDVIAPLVDNEYHKCSDKLRILKENFSHDQFQINGEEIIFPYIKMKVCTISPGTKGTKLSTLTGAKTTIQRIYPDGYFRDEFGRNIDQVFPSTAIINRTVAGLPYEIFVTSIPEMLKIRIERNEITPAKTFEFVEKFFDILGASAEFQYTKMTPDSLYEYIKQDFLRVILMPYSNNIGMECASKLKDLAVEYLGYKPLKIFVGTGKDVIQTTSDHVVGYLYTYRDLHDCEYGSSSTSAIERDTKGFASDHNNSKRDSKTIYRKKNTKIDIQNQHIDVNLLTNADADIMLNGSDPSDAMYNVKETMQAISIDMDFRLKPDTEE